MSKRKARPADRARVEYRFDDGSTESQMLVDRALALIRQWAALERMQPTTLDDAVAQQAVRDKLRRVAELAVNAEADLFAVTEGGRKGGSRGTNSKADAILAEAANRPTIGTGEIQAIARRTGAHVRTVRDTLKRAGKYTPQKKGK